MIPLDTNLRHRRQTAGELVTCDDIAKDVLVSGQVEMTKLLCGKVEIAKTIIRYQISVGAPPYPYNMSHGILDSGTQIGRL
jgi:hypothetical protein